MRTSNFMSILILLSLLIILTGCVTTRELGVLPSDSQDFSLPKDKLIEKYPDIAVYEKGDRFFYTGYCTDISEVMAQFGEPDEKKIQWLSYTGPFGLIGFAWSPLSGVVTTAYSFTVEPIPPKEYIWNKGIYNIVAVVRTCISCGYMDRLYYWDWNIRQLEAHNKSLE